MSADHDALIRTTKQLMAERRAIIDTLEAFRQKLEKRLDDSEARVVRTHQLLERSVALLQRSKMARTTADHTPPDPRG